MPTAFPSVGHSGTQSISLLTQSSNPEEHETEIAICDVVSSTDQVRQIEQLELQEQSPAASIARRETVKLSPVKLATTKSSAPANKAAKPAVMHRIAEVREQQGLSLRTVSRRTGIEVKELRSQEAEGSDLLLSQLIAWQKALEVPLVDLLEDDSQALSRPVKERAKMVRIMKTAVSLCEVSASQPRLSRLSTMLREQILDLMPELAEIGGWPQCGSRRGADVMGRIFHEQVAVDFGGID